MCWGFLYDQHVVNFDTHFMVSWKTVFSELFGHNVLQIISITSSWLIAVARSSICFLTFFFCLWYQLFWKKCVKISHYEWHLSVSPFRSVNFVLCILNQVFRSLSLRIVLPSYWHLYDFTMSSLSLLMVLVLKSTFLILYACFFWLEFVCSIFFYLYTFNFSLSLFLCLL